MITVFSTQRPARQSIVRKPRATSYATHTRIMELESAARERFLAITLARSTLAAYTIPNFQRLLATGLEAVGENGVAILPFLKAIPKIEFWAQAIFKSAYPKQRIMHSALKKF